MLIWLTSKMKALMTNVIKLSTMIMMQVSAKKISLSSMILHRTHKSMTCLLTHWLQVFGNVTMSKKVFYASSLVDVVRLLLVEEDLEERSIFFYVETLPLQSHSFSNMSTRLHLEVFIHQAKVPRQSVLQYMLLKTLKLERLYSRVVLLYYLIEVSAALMNLIRWMITQESFFMRQWNNKLSL
jgi:hypothetical protein